MSARRGRPAAAAIVGAALAVAVCATSAEAGKTYTFGVGDTFGIGGSKIECGIAAGVGYGLDLRGKTYVVCGPSTSVGNYVARWNGSNWSPLISGSATQPAQPAERAIGGWGLSDDRRCAGPEFMI